MISEDRYCIDVVRQVQAIKAALSGLEALILDDHLETCVHQALSGEDVGVRRRRSRSSSQSWAGAGNSDVVAIRFG